MQFVKKLLKAGKTKQLCKCFTVCYSTNSTVMQAKIIHTIDKWHRVYETRSISIKQKWVKSQLKQLAVVRHVSFSVHI